MDNIQSFERFQLGKPGDLILCLYYIPFSIKIFLGVRLFIN